MKFLPLLGVFFLAACSSSDDPDFVTVAPPEPVKLAVLHASPDAPAVNIIVDGNEVLSGVDYKVGSGDLDLTAGSYNIAVEGILPGGNAAVIGPVDLDFDGNLKYTIAAVNDVANIEPVIISQPDVAVSAGSARLFVLHGSAAAPTVDVYVTTPGADLAATAAVGTFSFKETIGPAEVAAGDYQIRVTAAGDATAVVFDSGTITLNDGDDLTVTAVPNTYGGAAPISLVAQTGAGSIEILDMDTPTSLQVVHISPDAPAVDVLANGGELVGDLAFPQATGFVEVPPGTYTVSVTVANNPGAIAIGPVDLDLAAGVRHSVLAVNALSMIEPLILTDDPRRVTTNAKVRIVHAASSAPNVDIYVTAVGADITAETPLLTDIPFKANTGYLAVPAGDYDVTVTATGTTTAAIGPATISVNDGGIYTAIARDPAPAEMGFNLILLDDF